ncbi:hypothetical protein IWQ61_002124 [Dispira simplex]|nr:hypothetical protein IWQ61_002124 [Dispira simplex]
MANLAHYATLSMESTVKSQEFTQKYYRFMDGQRSFLTQLYHGTSLIVWNGNGFQGGNDFVSGLLQTLPPTKHEIHACNAQPILAWNEPIVTTDVPYNILVQVSGTVLYDNSSFLRAFTQTFILTPDPTNPGNYYISNDTFRLV